MLYNGLSTQLSIPGLNLLAPPIRTLVVIIINKIPSELKEINQNR